MNRAVLVLSAACVLLLAVGCGGGSDVTTTASDNAQAGDSGIEGVPLPPGAKRIKGQLGVYWEVPGSDFDSVVAFYEDAMPEGEDWHDWAWCDTGGGDTIHAHIYAKGSRDILNVSIVDDKTPGILIGTDKSGPC